MDLGRALPNRKGSWEEAGIQAEVCGSRSSRMAEKVRGAHMAKKRCFFNDTAAHRTYSITIHDALQNFILTRIDYVTDYINNTTKQRELGFRTRTAFPMGKRLIFSEFTNVLFCY